MKKYFSKTLILSLVVLVLAATPLLAKSKAYMGVFLSDLSAGDFEELGLKENYGVFIESIVEESPAEEAGLQAQDVILQVAGDKIYTVDQITKMLTTYEPDQVVKIKVMRDDKTKTIKLTLGKKKGKEVKKKAFLGVYMQNLSEKYRKKIGLEDHYGVLIEKVVKDGPVQKAGMQNKDIILKIGEDKVYTSDQISQMLNYLKPEQQIKITAFRDKEYKTFDVILGEKEIPSFEFDTSGMEFLRDIPENIFVYKYDDKNGKWIGIQPKELNEQLLKTYNLENGVLIEKVFEDTPAEDAGLLAGDIITHINDQIMENTKGIIKLIQSKEIDDEIDIAIKRGTELKIIKTKIGKRQDLHSDQKVEVSFDEGDVRIMIDGDEELLLDLGDLKELEKLKELQYLKGEKMEHFNEQMEKLGEKLKDIKIDIIEKSKSKDI